MNTFLMQGVSEYRRQKQQDLKFDGYGRRLLALVKVGDTTSNHVLLLLLTPMIEMAWVDGRVGRAEQNAILRIADLYGLLEVDGDFLIIMDRLTTRPTEAEIEALWNDLYTVLAFLPLGQTAAVSSLLLEQTRHVAELGQKRIFGLWRGHASGENELLKIRETEMRFSSLQDSVAEFTSKASVSNGVSASDDCLKVLPLIKVAWADGRITKREREMIFNSLIDLGVEPTNENLKQLLEWLELNPDEEFFNLSLEKLREGFDLLDSDERANEKYSLISQCTLIAEASGGDSSSKSGGRLICEEEIATVKHIARLLKGAVIRNQG